MLLEPARWSADLPKDRSSCMDLGRRISGGTITREALVHDNRWERNYWVAFLSRGRWVTVPPTPLGVPTYLQKCTTSVVRGDPPTYRKVRHSVNLVLNLVLRSMHTKFSTVVGGTHLPTEMYDISCPGGPTYLQKCTTVAP